MTIFELVKIALDELYSEGQKIYGDGLDAAILERIKYLTASYQGLTSKGRQPVDYSDPATRFAYVYVYVAAHGDYVVQILAEARVKLGGSIFASENVRVTCIGGGPGSDVVAVLKYLDDYKKFEPVKKVTCYLLDREQAWADTWVEIDDSISSGVALHANFQPLDVTNPDSWKSQQKFLQADLFTMSYFVSEVFAMDDGGVVTSFWDRVFSEAKSGAIFLYDDNGSDQFNDYFDGLWKKHGLEPLVVVTNTRITPRFSEQSSELGEYKAKFGYNPKLKAQISYRVLRKP